MAIKNENENKTGCPEISLILPVYNVAPYMDTCLKSIIGQTFLDFEVLLVDDGSTDGSGECCDRWAEKHSCIRVIHKENGGVSSARNRGIEEARGAWLAFVDPDDWLDVTYLEKLYRAAKENGADIAECDIWRYNDRTREKIPRSCGGVMGVPWTREEHMIYGSTASYKAISRRDLWIKNGIRFPDCAFESPAVYALLLAAADRIVNIPEPLYYYRRFRPESLIETGYARKNGEPNNTLGIEAMEHLQAEFRRLGLYEKYRDVLGRLARYRLSDILATQFYRKNEADYRETAANFSRFLEERYPDTAFAPAGTGRGIQYLIFGGYNLNRILLHCDLLQDPYCRFNFSSLISIADRCPAGGRRIRHRNRYREMMLQREEDGTFWDVLDEVKPAYLFLDLIEERFDILERDGRYVTASDAREGAEEPETKLFSVRRIPRESTECRNLFRDACRRFTEGVHEISPETQIVTVENVLCETVGTGSEQRPYPDAGEIRNLNGLLRDMYEELAAADPGIIRIIPREEPELKSWLFTDEKYEYGAVPSHLNEIANRKIAGCIENKLSGRRPAVTVIIPVYNVETYLPACLDSVCAQTLKEIEILCIDDASPDGCPAILDRYAERDPRIGVFHLKENRGQGYGRNLGLAKASGRYVYFLDSDDMIEPDAMEWLCREADKERLDGIFFDSRAVFDSEILAKRYASYPAVRKGTYPEQPVSGPELFSLFIEQGEWTCYVQRQFWNREFLRRERIENPVRVEHEDEVFAFKAILAAERTAYRKKTFFIRRYRENSVMTSRPAPKNFYGYFMDLCYMYRFVGERGLQSTAIDRNLARIYEKLVRYYRDLSGEYDLESWFRTEEEKNLFRFFQISQKAWMHYGMLSDDLLRQAKESRHLYIYGAGVLAGQIFTALERQDLVIDGFLVTDKKGNPRALHGRPVTALEEAGDPGPGSLVIVAVTDGYAQEIFDGLEQAGWNYRYYKA